MGIGQLLTMSMFFANNAIHPLDLIPGWLRIVAQLNLLTYLVDALRGLMIVRGESVCGYGVDLAALIAAFVVLLMVAVSISVSYFEPLPVLTAGSFQLRQPPPIATNNCTESR